MGRSADRRGLLCWWIQNKGNLSSIVVDLFPEKQIFTQQTQRVCDCMTSRIPYIAHGTRVNERYHSTLQAIRDFSFEDVKAYWINDGPKAFVIILYPHHEPITAPH